MRKLFEEFFYISRNGKVCEKAMLTRIAMSVVLILFCMAAMSITAYAYFSRSITANISPVQSAVWRITAEPEPDVVLDGDFYAMDNHAGSAERSYRFVLTKAADATASHGYVRIDIKTDVDEYAAAQTYYSQPIGEFLVSGTMTEDIDREVTITVPAGKLAYVSFTGEWGTCAKEPVFEESEGIRPLFAESTGTEETTEPETTQEVTEPEITEEPTEPETTQAATEPEITEAPTEPETTQEITELLTTEGITEPENEPETTNDVSPAAE